MNLYFNDFIITLLKIFAFLLLYLLKTKFDELIDIKIFKMHN